MGHPAPPGQAPALASPPRWPRPGQPLGLVAPGGAFAPEAYQAGLAALQELAPGLTVRAGQELASRDGYFAGGDQERAGHLQRLLTDPGLGLVMAVRGGFGCSRLLPLMDLTACAQAGGCLLGFSDLTCLLNALASQGLVALHGPVLTQLPRLDGPSRADLAGLLAGRRPWPLSLAGAAVRTGRAVGPLLGGNLTLLCHLLGTPWFPPLTGAILLLEDTGEAAYRLDRLLTQLELAGVFGQVAGVAVGWLSQEAPWPEGLAATVERRLAGLGVPVVGGLPFGHGGANRLLPLGALAELDGQAGTLTVGLGLA
ncbi:MAG: LD-carboxypeptidase [Desulfarculus sp.]|nr:LD-carboxypeptidase [Desulfarculus sp.]